jgi:hypothetical protein
MERHERSRRRILRHLFLGHKRLEHLLAGMKSTVNLDIQHDIRPAARVSIQTARLALPAG